MLRVKKDCNRCDPGFSCKGMIDPEENCDRFFPPKDTWPLVELALEHPTSLNKALSALPFNIKLEDYL